MVLRNGQKIKKFVKEQAEKYKTRRKIEKKMRKEAQSAGEEAYLIERSIFLKEEAITQAKKRARRTRSNSLKDLQNQFKLDYITSPKRDGAQRSKNQWDLIIGDSPHTKTPKIQQGIGGIKPIKIDNILGDLYKSNDLRIKKKKKDERFFEW